MGPGSALAPVEGLGLVGQDETGLAFGPRELDGEGIAAVELGMRHGQADDDAGALVEGFGGQHEHGVLIAHFSADVRGKTDPDHVPPIRCPRVAANGRRGCRRGRLGGQGLGRCRPAERWTLGRAGGGLSGRHQQRLPRPRASPPSPRRRAGQDRRP